MIFTYVLFVVGFILLIKGADLLVDGASAVARRFGVSPLIVGLTIVSFGTSAPELFVNILSSIEGNAGIAIGNIVGSNIANILLVLGATAIIYPLGVQSNTIWKEIPFNILVVFILGVIVNDVLLDGATSSMLSRTDGLVLLGFFLIFLGYTYMSALDDRNVSSTVEEEESEEDMPMWKSFLLVILGLVGLGFGGDWIVDGAVLLASSFAVSQEFIGMSVVAVGTSLPELATSMVAAFKKDTDIAIGNAIGSNIFNILLVLGVTSTIAPIPFSNATADIDVLVMTSATLLCFFVLFVGKRHMIERWQGIIFVILYVVYIATAIIRQ